MTETRGLLRAEFAVAAFGVTAFLLALIFVLDAVRFHHDVLLDALQGLVAGHVRAQEFLLLAIALFDVVALIRAAASIWRGVSAHRRVLARLSVLERREIAGRPVVVVAGDRALAFCGGLLRPCVFVSEGALARLGEKELAAVVAHEGHHADRRDPARIMVARAIGDAYSLRALPHREQALGELAADAAAVRRGGAASLAGALLAFHEDDAGIAPERVDRLAGARPSHEVSRVVVAAAGLVLAALVGLLVAGVLASGHPRFCLPLASAPGGFAVAMLARVLAMGPAWLGWRRAGHFLRPV